MHTTHPPYGTFTGRNFMTPDFIEHRYRQDLRGRAAWVEISSGSGMDGSRIYGVTFRRSGGERIEPDDPSTCVATLAEARALALEAL